jgi:hypothetical protein
MILNVGRGPTPDKPTVSLNVPDPSHISSFMDFPVAGAPDSPSTIQDTKRYLQGFGRLQKTATSDQELFDQMTELYPDWVANQSWLMFGFPQA